MLSPMIPGGLSRVDIVYVNRPGDENEELRHSLRSLINIPHDRVWIVGYTPPWVEGVSSIPVESMRDKHTSAERNLIAACQHPEISDPFLLFNDDMFVMQPLEEIPSWHMGPLDKAIAEHRYGSAYRAAMQKTRDRMVEQGHDPQELLCYELHIPMLIEKVGMLLALSLGKGIHGLHNRTMYGNLMGLGGEQHEDVKVYRGDKAKSYESMPLLSTSDRTFKYHPVGRYIQRAFPDPGLYERDMPKAPVGKRVVRYSSVITHPQ